MLRGKKVRGFTLLELLIVVAIIGLIAALMIPNLLQAIQKAKQKRTMADMRNIGTAWMSWVTDQLSAASAASPAGPLYRGTELTDSVTYLELNAMLRPNDSFFYMQEIPQFDAWLYPLVFAKAPNLKSSSVVAMGSGASDGNTVNLNVDIPVEPFRHTDFVSDIIWADGYFVTWPDNLGHAR